jgi:hypothetical protein
MIAWGPSDLSRSPNTCNITFCGPFVDSRINHRHCSCLMRLLGYRLTNHSIFPRVNRKLNHHFHSFIYSTINEDVGSTVVTPRISASYRYYLSVWWSTCMHCELCFTKLCNWLLHKICLCVPPMCQWHNNIIVFIL